MKKATVIKQTVAFILKKSILLINFSIAFIIEKVKSE